ncbi:MAG TPA: PaaI family thioesterase [Solirubrobacteraceae bacterium]|jgi:uncharacterized protein (TIGR00369 family)|nr:PaaI family thioesterase [Solirubrobacteraceae bacterium]
MADESSDQRPAARRAEGEPSVPARGQPRGGDGPRSLDGVSGFMGLHWDDPQTVRMRIRPELINGGGMLSGVATYAMVDYCMGSTLWVQTTREERIATISIAINYVQTATDGEVVCRTTLDRRNRSTAVMRSQVNHEDGRLLVTAVGSYAIFPARKRPATSTPATGTPATSTPATSTEP